MEADLGYGRRRGRKPGTRPGVASSESGTDPPEPDGTPIYEPRPVQCPKCCSENTYIYHTNSRVRPKKRYRCCRDCGERFLTFQRVES